MQKTQYAFELRLGREKMLLRMNSEQHLNKYVWNSNRHCNADYELHIILRGACSLDVEEQHYLLQAPQAILIAPGQYHRPQSLPGEFERFSLSFSLTGGTLLETLRKTVPTSKVYSITDEILSNCRSIFYESAAGNPFRQEMLQALLTRLLLCNFRLLSITEQTNVNSHPITDAERTDLIDAFFESHMAEKAGEAALAAKLHLSRRQLARVLQENYGMGFQKKLILARMDHAAWLLRSTGKPVGEIAGIVGYASEAAFYQVFRSRFEMTPQQYRSMFKKQSGEEERL